MGDGTKAKQQCVAPIKSWTPGSNFRLVPGALAKLILERSRQTSCERQNHGEGVLGARLLIDSGARRQNDSALLEFLENVCAVEALVASALEMDPAQSQALVQRIEVGLPEDYFGVFLDFGSRSGDHDVTDRTFFENLGNWPRIAGCTPDMRHESLSPSK